MNKFFAVKSEIKKYSFTSFKQLAEDIRKFKYAVVYKLDGVTVDLADNITEELLRDDLLELRAFNFSGELHLIVNDSIIGRIRSDIEGETIECLDEDNLIWGEPKEHKDVKTFMSEDRGTMLWLPINVPDGSRAFVTVRNYLSSENEPFEFVDYRMVDFVCRPAKSYDLKGVYPNAE